MITGTENRNTHSKNNRNPNTVAYFNRRIGSTTYVVKTCFSETTNRTMQDRILHMIENELLTESPKPFKPAKLPATNELSGLKGVNP